MSFSFSVFADEQIPAPTAAPSALQELASPWTTSAQPWLLGGSALTLFLIATDDSIDKPFQRYSNENKPLGQFSRVGYWAGLSIPNAAYILGMFAAQNKSKALVMTKATLYAQATTLALKLTVREPRPDNSDYASFPSGHTSSAFAFAAVIGEMESKYWAVPAYGLAAVVGYSRINDNKHFLHDVVAGATIGMAYGIGISQLNGRDNALNENKMDVALVPLRSGGFVYSNLKF